MNNRRRIFIAVNLPEDIKEKLNEYQYKWSDLPAKWTKKDNIHITLAFLGYIRDEELIEVCKLVKEVSQRHSPLSINLNKICYGPLKKIPPRMVWAVGENSDDFISLKNDLDKSLIGSVNFHAEKREFSLHITLARVNQWGFKKIEPEERPVVDEDINLTFEADSIDIMESELKRGGPKYDILESCSLRIET
ncbi:MAG: RNA 2',3'-cyclic phosphodiesterase [Candidatus Pacebacteria bacterium]|nr:RNA 2',3'-cyclic phosphodiesterase [Candidatus Paceibacterota bacterium]